MNSRSTSRRQDRVRCRVAPSALALLESARQGLASAESEVSAGGRYVGAHLAALRAAAAIVAARAEPAAPRRRRPLSVWELLPKVDPTLSEWAAFFAAGAGKRAAAEAGLPRAVTRVRADELLRDAGTFVALAETALGVPAQSPLRCRRPSKDGNVRQVQEGRRSRVRRGSADSTAPRSNLGSQLMSSSVRSVGVLS